VPQIGLKTLGGSLGTLLGLTIGRPAGKYSQLCGAVIAGFGACEKDVDADNDDSGEDTSWINGNTK
jgi:hypothetical protein